MGAKILTCPGGAHMSRAGPVLGGNSCWTNKSIFMTHLGGIGEDCRVDILTTDSRWVARVLSLLQSVQTGFWAHLSNGYWGFCFGFKAAGVQNYLSRPSSPKLRIIGYVVLYLHSHTHLHDVPKWLKIVATVGKYTAQSIPGGMLQDPEYLPYCTGLIFVKMLPNL